MKVKACLKMAVLIMAVTAEVSALPVRVDASFDGAKWIGDPGSRNPAFAKTFAPGGKVVSATLAVTGVGWYEAYLNGRKIGDKVLDPIPTQYDKRILYSTYDVTDLIADGANELKVLLGNGLYNVQEKCVWSFDRVAWKADPAAIAALALRYEDGTVERIVTDGSWRVAPSPVLFSGFREGEVVLAEPRMDGAPRTATVLPGPAGRLDRETVPAAKVVRDVPVERTETLADGSTVYRMAENMAGWARIRFSGLKKGDVVTIRYDERPPQETMRHIDRFCRSLPSTNVCPELAAETAGFQTDRFVSAGGAEEFYEPRFSYNGFRYVTVKGAAPAAKDVTGRFVRTSFAKTGSFECDSHGFMKVMAATARAYESNFTDGFPTDCPHREKNGWLGDAALAIPYAALEWGSEENTLAYCNWIRTIGDGQADDGRIASIAPHSGYFHFDGHACAAGPAWGAALTTIPTALYRYRRDSAILSEAYPAMKKYVDKLLTERTKDGVVDYGLGDWCAVSWTWSKDRNFRTSAALTSTAFAFLSVTETAVAAELLGFRDDAVRFRAEAEKLRTAFNAKFYRGGGIYDKNGSPTAQATALEFGLVEPSEIPAVRKRLVEAVHEMDDKIDFGILGARTVFRQLCEAGEVDLAWKLIMRPDYPSYLNMVSQDVNTLMETFNGNCSRNHIMFGDVGAWAYEYLAGIQVGRENAGTGLAITVRPFVPKALNHVKASVELVEGRVAVEWTKQDGIFILVLDIPDGIDATVVMPDGKACRGHARHQEWTCPMVTAAGLEFVDPLIGTEGAGSQYGGMQPYTCVPFGSFHAVPMTRTNRIGRLSFNSSDETLLGIMLTRQPAIWMGDWGEVRIEVPSAKIEMLDAKPYLTRVAAGGRMYEYTATAHAAWIRGLDESTVAAFPESGINTNRMDAKYGYPLPNFGGRWYADKSCPGELKIGLSLISIEQAKANLAKEIGARTFDEVVAETKVKWEEMFSRIVIDAPDDVKTIFYTGLYHALLYPRQMDEDGRYYSAFDDKVHSGTRYNCFSLWDTYRAEHPWLTLIAPERVDGMMQSLVDMYKEGGWLPKWPNPSYTGIMVGAPAEIVLQEAMSKGFMGFDWTAAREAIRKNATVPQEHDVERRWEDRGMFGLDPETRAGLTSYLKRGYVACDETAESVSRTQDFSLADRNRNYTNLWCAAEGMFLPRKADGTFVSRKELNPPYHDYCEQQPETGVWAVPHDPEGLAELMGGKTEAIRRLDEFFDTIFFKPDGRGNGSIHGNETSHHCAYLYNRFGAAEKTQWRVRQILTRCYSTNRKGFDGNEDCGQMSAWYILSALGFYPLDPASGEYELGSPLVRKAKLKIGRAALDISVGGYAPDRWRVKRVTLNGKPVTDGKIRHADIVRGGELVFECER